MSSSERKRPAAEPGSFRPLRFPAADTVPAAGAAAAPPAEHAFHFPDLGGRAATSLPAGPGLKQRPGSFRPSSFVPYEPDERPAVETAEEAHQRLLAQMERSRARHEEELDRLRRETEREAERMVAEAGLQTEGIRREAAEKGYHEGLARADGRIDEQVRQLAEILRRLAVVERLVVERHERQLVDLAAAIARRVVHQELTVNDEALVAIARSVLNEIPLHGIVTLKLHPEDYEILAPRMTELQRDHERLEHVVLVPHEGIERGGLLLDTPIGQVDASLESVFAEIEAALCG